MKRCSKCGIEKHVECFGEKIGGKNGLRSICKGCHNAERKPRSEWSDKTRISVREWEKKQRDSLSDWWVKKSILITSKGKIKTKQITPEMIEARRKATLELRFKRENHLLKKDTIFKGPYKHKCIVCGIDFISKMPFADVCSKPCERTKQLKDKREKYRKGWQQPEPFECLECGKLHQPEFGDKHDKYCSDKCMNRNVKRNQHHKRRQRLKDGFTEPVYKARIFKRDKGKCQICGKKVAIKQKAPHPYSPSLDHIIPLSKGGTHGPRNIRLVHFICNSIKSDGVSSNGDQLLLFG